MTAPDITLKQAKEKAIEKNGVREHRVSDFLTDEQVEEVRKTNAKGRKTHKFDQIDAYIAEIIARFGYQTYLAWKSGDISEENMVKYIEAERVREMANILSIKSVIVAANAGANNPTKAGHAPKSLKAAIDMLKKDQNFIKGGK